jgi:hypothetical protein
MPTYEEESVVAIYEPSVLESGVMPVTPVPAAHATASHRHAMPTPATTHVTASPTTTHVTAAPTTAHVAATTMTPTTVRGDSK